MKHLILPGTVLFIGLSGSDEILVTINLLSKSFKIKATKI